MAAIISLGLVDGNSSTDVIFPLRPESIPREYGAAYVPIPIALADYSPSYPSGAPAPVAWIRNTPERIDLRLLLVDQVTLGTQNGRDDIETEILRLENFRYISPRTGEPPDLVLTIGDRHDRVRMENLHIDPTIYTPDLRRQQARVDIKLVVIRPRSQ